MAQSRRLELIRPTTGEVQVDVRGHDYQMGDADQEDSREAVGKEVRRGAEVKRSWIVAWPPRRIPPTSSNGCVVNGGAR